MRKTLSALGSDKLSFCSLWKPEAHVGTDMTQKRVGGKINAKQSDKVICFLFSPWQSHRWWFQQRSSWRHCPHMWAAVGGTDVPGSPRTQEDCCPLLAETHSCWETTAHTHQDHQDVTRALCCLQWWTLLMVGSIKHFLSELLIFWGGKSVLLKVYVKIKIKYVW